MPVTLELCLNNEVPPKFLNKSSPPLHEQKNLTLLWKMMTKTNMMLKNKNRSIENSSKYSRKLFLVWAVHLRIEIRSDGSSFYCNFFLQNFYVLLDVYACGFIAAKKREMFMFVLKEWGVFKNFVANWRTFF